MHDLTMFQGRDGQTLSQFLSPLEMTVFHGPVTTIYRQVFPRRLTIR